ncbi:radical SAM/SPASM domain-containing protein [Salidesulfovibrio onnuriiensis]|uniref:radical SAM/SPASM domain-containing protein n=1 Tax=Salidesulfovibrio onnuriiensis TaxID=2583823 RepID=UPI0011CA9BE2|nr:radical SAM/SPASM domain-containing protein [Salidesulfovibrio onnuriiensis]
MLRNLKEKIRQTGWLFRLILPAYKFLSLCKLVVLADASFGQRFNYLLCAFSAWRRSEKCLGSPVNLGIEPTNACNLKCTICETGTNDLGRKKGFLSFDDFIRILDRFDGNLNQLYFYFMGEPFLNRDAYRMIRYAADKGIWVTTCTNGDVVDPERLVDSGIGEVNFQTGGFSQETHGTYRRGSDLSAVRANLERTIELRNARGMDSRDMKITLGFILMRHNEHELEDFIAYCEKVGVDEYNIIGTCLRTADQAETYLPSDPAYRIYDEDKLKQGKVVPRTRPDNHCGEIYSSITVQVNGDVVACCRDPKGKRVLGNLLDQTLAEVWNGEKYGTLRRDVSTSSNSLQLCRLCPGQGLYPLARDWRGHKRNSQ